MKRPVTLVIGVLGVAVIAGGLWFARTWANNPVVVRPEQAETTTEPANTAAVVPISGVTFRTLAPLGFTVREQHSRSTPLRIDSVVANDSTGKVPEGQFAVTVFQGVEGGVMGLSDVVYRQRNSDKYTLAQIAGQPAGAVVYRQVGTYELSVFFAHGSYVASVVLSAASADTSMLDAQMTTALGGWEWL